MRKKRAIVCFLLAFVFIGQVFSSSLSPLFAREESGQDTQPNPNKDLIFVVNGKIYHTIHLNDSGQPTETPVNKPIDPTFEFSNNEYTFAGWFKYESQTFAKEVTKVDLESTTFQPGYVFARFDKPGRFSAEIDVLYKTVLKGKENPKLVKTKEFMKAERKLRFAFEKADISKEAVSAYVDRIKLEKAMLAYKDSDFNYGGRTVKVNFFLENGEKYIESTIPIGQSVPCPPTPPCNDKRCYSRVNWVKENGDAYYPTNSKQNAPGLTEDLNLYLKPIGDRSGKPCTVFFKINDDVVAKLENQECGASFPLPEGITVPDKEGYQFDGWYVHNPYNNKEEKWIFDSSDGTWVQNKSQLVDIETTIYAKFSLDKSKLQKLVDQSAQYKEDEYTPESWEAFNIKLQVAKKELEKTDSTKESVGKAFDELKASIEQLQKKSDSAKNDLKNLVNTVKDFKEEDYTPASWTGFKNALDKAKEVLEEENPTLESLKKAKENLENAKRDLKKKSQTPDPKPADKSALKEAIEEYSKLKEEDYSKETWSDFKEALGKAKKIEESDKATQEEVNQTLASLNEAHNRLKVSKEEKLALKSVVPVDPITVKVGTSLDQVKNQLPSYVKLIGTDDKTYYAPVTWKIYNYSKGNPGIYNARGLYNLPSSLDKSRKQKTIFTNVNVVGEETTFKSFAPLNKISIKKGTTPNLPSTVLVYFKDGSSQRLAVTWDLANFKKDTPGEYTLLGTVKDLKEKVSLVVEVQGVDEGQKLETTGNKKIIIRDIAGHWAENAIKWTLQNSLFYGNDRQEFEPNRTISRGEFMAVLFRVTGENPSKYHNQYFDDIHKGEYFESAVEWGRRKNVITGYEDGLFHPDDPLTREQQATIIHRFNNVMNFKFEGRGSSNFKDEGQIGSWARQAVKTLQAQGLMRGDEHNRFMPKSKITRAEVAQILYNMDNKVLSTGTVQGNKQNIETTSQENKGEEQIAMSSNQGGILSGNRESYTPLPLKPDENQSSTGEKKQAQVTISIDALTALNRLEEASSNVRGKIPRSGYFVQPIKVNITPGESVWDVTRRVGMENGLVFDYDSSKFNSVYVSRINGLGEYDMGESSGWMYNINGVYPNRGASSVKLRDGDYLQWRYTCVKGDLTSELTPVPDRM